MGGTYDAFSKAINRSNKETNLDFHLRTVPPQTGKCIMTTILVDFGIEIRNAEQ